MHRFAPKDFINYLALSIPVEGLFQKHVRDTKFDIYVFIFIIIFITFKIVSLKCWGQQLKLFLVFFCKSKNYKSEFVKYVSPFRHDWQNLGKFCKGLTQNLYFCTSKWMRTDIFFTRTTKTHMQFREPCNKNILKESKILKTNFN
jgi:hypothetical protein